MKNTSQISKRMRIRHTLKGIKSNKMKIAYLLELSRSYIMRGKKGLNDEIEIWEDTVDVITDNSLMRKINEVRSRIAKSV